MSDPEVPEVAETAIDGKFEGTVLKAVNLWYSAQNKVILKDVSFALKQGSMCALMGPSGAGKSTLLDLLAGRKIDGVWSGFQNFPSGKKDSSYVLQSDLHLGTLTVKETIYYSCWARFKAGTSRKKLMERTNYLLKLLEIDHIADSLVGDQSTRGISGGQLKRLSIAVEIVNLPSLLYLDEPTSGLDSSTALSVMSAVRNLVGKDRTCISTIHQPSPEIFALFDDLVLLSAGRIVYYGPTKDVVSYFMKTDGLTFEMEDGKNPAEFILEITEGHVLPNEKKAALSADELEQVFLSSGHHKLQLEQCPLVTEEVFSDTITTSTTDSMVSDIGFTLEDWLQVWNHFQMIFHRTTVAIMRDTEWLGAFFGKSIGVGFIFGVLMYMQAGQDIAKPYVDEDGNPNGDVVRLTGIFFIVIGVLLVSNVESIPWYFSRYLVYRREIASGSYTTVSYWLVQCLIIIPLLCGGFFLTETVISLCAQFQYSSIEFFAYFFLVGVFANLTAFYWAMFLGAFCNDEELAMTWYPLTFLVLSAFAGFVIATDELPSYWMWFPYIDFQYFAFAGLAVNVWHQYDDSESILEVYNLEDYEKITSYWVLWMFIIFMVSINYYAMLPATNKLEKTDDVTGMKLLVGGAASNDESGASETNEEYGTFRDELGLAVDKTYSLTFRDLHYYVRVGPNESSNSSVASSPAHQAVSNPVTNDPTNEAGSVVSDISTSMNSRDFNMKHILKGVSGRAEPGEVVALMGASGAGKTTLLDILANRKTMGEISGEILMNGVPVTRASSRATAYVMQDNVHYIQLTVRENLTFAAQLRMPENTTMKMKISRVNMMLKMLKMEHVADMVTGGELIRGISGGQLKRLSIGVEIIHFPGVIFLDEPTTGLDSHMAFEIMNFSRKLANLKRTIICTIHQPSVSTFKLFDKLILMVAGQVIYFGPLKDAVSYFTDSPYGFVHPREQNPADFVVCVAEGKLADKDGNVVAGEALIAHYYSSKQYEDFVAELKQQVEVEQDGENFSLLSGNDDEDEDTCITSWYNQIKTLCKRNVLMYFKEYDVLIASWLRQIFAGLFYGTIFLNLDDGTDSTAYTNRLALLFFSLALGIMVHQQDIAQLQKERIIFYRERGSHCVSPFAYWLSRIVTAIPLTFLNAFLYSLVVYYLAGLTNEHGAFWFFFTIMWMTDTAGLVVCYIASGLAAHTQMATGIFTIIAMVSFSSAGYLVYIPDLPTYTRGWLPYLVFLRYGFQSLVLNEFSGNEDLPERDEYIGNLGFRSLNRFECIGYFSLLLAALIAASYLVLKYVNYEKR